jgi:DNA-directed RNA polymerase specialized sigma subunit
VKNHYIDNKRFEKLIKAYQEDPSGCEDELFQMFDMLIGNIITSFSFKLDYDDAKQECFLIILKTLKNFNKDNGSAFNYFTTIILNNLKLLYTKDKKYCEKINNYINLRKDLLDP